MRNIKRKEVAVSKNRNIEEGRKKQSVKKE
jgi:hypothetical protein